MYNKGYIRKSKENKNKTAHVENWAIEGPSFPQSLNIQKKGRIYNVYTSKEMKLTGARTRVNARARKRSYLPELGTTVLDSESILEARNFLSSERSSSSDLDICSSRNFLRSDSESSSARDFKRS